ncbi:MAG: DUF523 and DUF1722 domain-containing protein [Desulfobacteraceae bacterium]|nr:DUF523 and DUF1722 domain-containing protein [Desulfobacteraceae bacterium]
MEEKVRIGISTCLLGEPVRWNGGHSRDRFITDTLGQYFEWVPVCPEVECGLPVPRETLRQVGDPENPRLVTTKTGVDHTERMLEWAAKRVRQLEKEGLCGFIFKSKSPSSGMERVKVYNAKGHPENKGVGMFARAFMNHFPLVPVEEEGRLHDPRLRENFIEAVFVLRRWRETVRAGNTMGNLVDFHTRHKLLLLAHNPAMYKEMGKMVAGGKKLPPDELYADYEKKLIAALRLKATARKNVNVLQHLLGYFKKELSADEKKELLDIIDQYRQGNVPLIVPITLVNHYVRKYDQPYLRQQVYLQPHPVDLKLRNHV